MPVFSNHFDDRILRDHDHDHLGPKADECIEYQRAGQPCPVGSTIAPANMKPSAAPITPSASLERDGSPISSISPGSLPSPASSRSVSSTRTPRGENGQHDTAMNSSAHQQVTSAIDSDDYNRSSDNAIDTRMATHRASSPTLAASASGAAVRDGRSTAVERPHEARGGGWLRGIRDLFTHDASTDAAPAPRAPSPVLKSKNPAKMDLSSEQVGKDTSESAKSDADSESEAFSPSPPTSDSGRRPRPRTSMTSTAATMSTWSGNRDTSHSLPLVEHGRGVATGKRHCAAATPPGYWGGFRDGASMQQAAGLLPLTDPHVKRIPLVVETAPIDNSDFAGANQSDNGDGDDVFTPMNAAMRDEDEDGPRFEQRGNRASPPRDAAQGRDLDKANDRMSAFSPMGANFA